MNKKLTINQLLMISTGTFRLLVTSMFFIAVLAKPVTAAEVSINSGQSCSSRGQIRDFQAQRFICLKVNAKAGSSKGLSLVWVKISSPKNSTKPSSTTTTTTTTAPSICQEGNVCKVGDRGPGGGLVFYVNPDRKSPDWQYLELAPTYLNPSNTSSANSQPALYTFPQALLGADKYKTDTKDDWFLPTHEQLVLAIENLWYLPKTPMAFKECSPSSCLYTSFWTSTESADKFSAAVVRASITASKLTEPTKNNPRSSELMLKAHANLNYVVAIRGEKQVSKSTPASTSAPSSDTVGLDPFPTRPMGRTFIWRNSMLEPHKWELGIERYFDVGTRPGTYLSLTFPSGDSFGSCTDPASYVRFKISFAHDVPGGSSAIYQGSEGGVERCSYSGINVVSISSSRYGSLFFGAGGNSFLNDFPKSNREKDTPVVFWVRVIGEHPHIGFRTDSGWIKVDLRKWLDS